MHQSLLWAGDVDEAREITLRHIDEIRFGPVVREMIEGHPAFTLQEAVRDREALGRRPQAERDVIAWYSLRFMGLPWVARDIYPDIDMAMQGQDLEEVRAAIAANSV